MNNNNPDNWDGLGHVLQYMGNFTGALAAYNKALVLTPHNPDLIFNRNLTQGIVLYQSDNFSDAVKVYDATLKVSHNPYLLQVRNLALYWEKGLLSEKEANYTGARDYFKKVLSIVPNDSEANNNEGLALFHLGNKTAIKFFDKAISLDPTNYDTLWNKAYTLLMWNNNTGAASAFQKVLQEHNDSAANDNLGVALFNLGNHSALKFFNKAIVLNQSDSNAFFNRGAFLQSEKDYKDAISSYSQALLLNPHDRDARENLAIAKSQLFKSMCCVGGANTLP